MASLEKKSATERTNKIEFSFVSSPKKLGMFLSNDQKSVYDLFFDYEQMIKSDSFEMSISYICKNRDIANQKAQTIINELIAINCIIKHVTEAGKMNRYSINHMMISEFDLMTNEQVFKKREEKNKMLKTLKVAKQLTQTTTTTNTVAEYTTTSTATIDTDIIECINEENAQTQIINDNYMTAKDDERVNELTEMNELEEIFGVENDNDVEKAFDSYLKENARIPLSLKLRSLTTKFSTDQLRVISNYVETSNNYNFGMKATIKEQLSKAIAV